MTPGADESWQVLPLLHPSVVHRRSAVAQQQRPAVQVGRCLSLLLVAVGWPALAEADADVTVGVDKPGHDPALGDRRDRVDPFVGHVPVHDVQVAGLVLGEEHAANVQSLRLPRVHCGLPAVTNPILPSCRSPVDGPRLAPQSPFVEMVKGLDATSSGGSRVPTNVARSHWSRLTSPHGPKDSSKWGHRTVAPLPTVRVKGRRRGRP